MGEYGRYDKTEIKIGTCEDMMYLRWEQRHMVEAIPGNVDPVKEINSLWFRLPRILESIREPGDFPFLGFNGARPIPIYIKPGTQLEEDVQEFLEDESHMGSIHFRSEEAGVQCSVPCNHGIPVKDLPKNMCYNGFNSNTLCITAVGVRREVNPDSNCDLSWGWRAFVLVACRVCGRTLFRFSREELQQCGLLHIQDGARLAEDAIDFQSLPGYLLKMECDAEVEFPTSEADLDTRG
jgi:hypothetical protein